MPRVADVMVEVLIKAGAKRRMASNLKRPILVSKLSYSSALKVNLIPVSVRVTIIVLVYIV
jgi:hypothetical protein